MSHLSPRWAIGTARRSTGAVARRIAGRLGLKPGRSAGVPRPRRLARHESPLGLTHVLVASDLNSRYLDAWPLARQLWEEIVGIEAVLILVADPAAVPGDLRRDTRVRVFPPLRGVHTALQAQCVRLLYPALLDGAGGVLLSDVDMLPMRRSYFTGPASRVGEHQFLAYRDVLLGENQIPICYNAARPRTWSEIFDVSDERDVRGRLGEWASGTEYDGTPGGPGWSTDQIVLHRALLDFGRRTARVWILDDAYTGFRRLERMTLAHNARLTDADERLIRRRAFSDAHIPLPFTEFRLLNEEVAERAVNAAAGR